MLRPIDATGDLQGQGIVNGPPDPFAPVPSAPVLAVIPLGDAAPVKPCLGPPVNGRNPNAKEADMQADFDIIRKKWNGITIEIRWTLDYLTYDDGRSMTHLEIQSLDRSPLPVAVSGYRSDFIPEADIVRFGGAEAYVDAMLGNTMSRA